MCYAGIWAFWSICSFNVYRLIINKIHLVEGDCAVFCVSRVPWGLRSKSTMLALPRQERSAKVLRLYTYFNDTKKTAANTGFWLCGAVCRGCKRDSDTVLIQYTLVAGKVIGQIV